MKLIYVSCKFGGDERRIELCEKIIRELVQRDRRNDIYDRVYISPLHTFGYLYNDVSYSDGLDMCLEQLRRCDELYVINDYGNSRGCNAEIGFAKALNMPIKFILKEDFVYEGYDEDIPF